MIDCACGCGIKIESHDNRNRPKRYVWGHAGVRAAIERNKGRPSWNKGKKLHYDVWNKGLKRPEISGANNPFYGKKHTEETRAKMRGENNGNWRNGVSTENQLARKSIEYIEWRKSVFIRDNRMCVLCGSTDRIEADHIKPFSTYPESRFDINNGRTLCHECHRATDTYGNLKKTRVLDE